MPSPAAAAELAHAIEQSVAGVPCGLQDQLAAAFGGLNVWHWSADPETPRYRRQVVAADWAGVDFNDCILIAYGGVPHLSKDINGAWVREFVAGHNRSDWHQMVRLSREFAAALSAGELERAQVAMNTEFDLRCRLTPAVVDDIGAQLVRTARDHGCSARFSGAGGGGCIWALGEPSRITQLRSVWQQVVARQEQARILEVKIDRDGIL
jgi:D-glycero-alpha-D-manno-heptose-7-phosphate kinase